MIIWLVQTNLGAHQDYVIGIKNGCDRFGHRFVGFKAIPFSGEVPACDGKGPTIAYGSVDVITTVYKSGIYSPGVFQNNNFKYSKYVKNLGSNMLNKDGKITTLQYIKDNIEEIRSLYAEDNHVFIRPNKDLKEFVGEVVDLDDLTSWIDKIDRKRTLLSPKVKAVIAKPYKINYEWRLFVVDKEIISASRYKKHGKLEISSEDVPNEVITFTEKSVRKWAPHAVSVVDICETGGELYIVEFNCFNSSGFYKNNIPLITGCISQYIEGETE